MHETIMLESIPLMVASIQDSLSDIEVTVRTSVQSVSAENMENNVTPFVELWGYTIGSFLLVLIIATNVIFHFFKGLLNCRIWATIWKRSNPSLLGCCRIFHH